MCSETLHSLRGEIHVLKLKVRAEIGRDLSRMVIYTKCVMEVICRQVGGGSSRSCGSIWVPEKQLQARVLAHQPCKPQRGKEDQGAQCKERRSSTGRGVVLCFHEGL